MKQISQEDIIKLGRVDGVVNACLKYKMDHPELDEASLLRTMVHYLVEDKLALQSQLVFQLQQRAIEIKLPENYLKEVQ